MDLVFIEKFKNVNSFQKALDLHNSIPSTDGAVRTFFLNKMAAYARVFWHWWEVYIKSPTGSALEKRALENLHAIATEPEEFLKLYLIDKDEERKEKLFTRIIKTDHPFSEMQNLYNAITDQNKRERILEKMLEDATELSHSMFVYKNAPNGSNLGNRARKKNAQFKKTA